MKSIVLERLIEEVRNERERGTVNAYNRMHNRHNRSGGGGYPRPAPPPEEPAR